MLDIQEEAKALRIESKLANPPADDDIAFIQSNDFPEHIIEAVSFENMPFALQLEQIANTDIDFDGYSRGRKHSFHFPPPDHAEFQEVFPPGLTARRRFQYVYSSRSTSNTSNKLPTLWTTPSVGRSQSDGDLRKENV